MRDHVPCIVSCTALGLTLAATIPAAHAQTIYDAAQSVIAPPPVTVAPPATAVIAPPPTLRAVRTVTTTTTTHPVRHSVARRRVITRHTHVTGRVAPATTTTTTVATTLAPPPYARAPLYDAVVQPPPPTVEPYDTVPLYDADTDVAPGPAIIPAVAAPAAVPVGSVVPAYRYVYQDDRILVIDPNTGIAVQAIPR